jgi:hypothetical protein
MSNIQELVSKLEKLETIMYQIASEMNEVVTAENPEFEAAFDNAILSVQQTIDCLNEVA